MGGATDLRRRALLLAALAFLAQPATAQIASLSPREAYEGARSGTLFLVDIRTPDEWADTGVPQGAEKLDADGSGFEVRLAGLRLDHPARRIALIDRTGSLSAAIRQKFAGRGWRDLVVVRGGMLGSPGEKGWLAEGLPVTPYP